MFAENLKVDAVSGVNIERVRRVQAKRECIVNFESTAEKIVSGQIPGHPPGIDPPHRRSVLFVFRNGIHA